MEVSIQSASAATTQSVIITTVVQLIMSSIELQTGFNLWMSANFLMIAKFSLLISDSNQVITQYLGGSVNIVSFELVFIRRLARHILFLDK